MFTIGILILVILAIVGVAVVIGLNLINSSGDEQTNQENDAKRFARLLVTEIKLYNDYKVMRGLQNNNLSESLKDEIAKARKKYDSRFNQPNLEAYFSDALIEVLADGDRSKMGN